MVLVLVLSGAVLGIAIEFASLSIWKTDGFEHENEHIALVGRTFVSGHLNLRCHVMPSACDHIADAESGQAGMPVLHEKTSG